MSGYVERLIQHEAKLSAVFVSRHPPSAVFACAQAQAVLLVLYCSYSVLVIWLGAIFSSTQTAVIFSDQDISKCYIIYF